MAEWKDSLSLPQDLAVTAQRELNETPTSRRQAIAEFKRSIDNDEDDAMILRFLRCKKFDVQRALSVYSSYNEYRRNNPNIFNDLSADSVKHIWESGVIGGLDCRDLKGRAVMVSFPGKWDPETHSLEDVLGAMIYQLEQLIKTNETQINGIVLIADFTDFTFYQARCIRPWYFQAMSSLVQNAFPARFKGVYVLNQPWYISLIMAAISRLLTEKMNSRIHMLGSEVEQLSQHFDMRSLPAEFGGSSPPYRGTDWIEVMRKCEEEKEEKIVTPTTTTPPILLQTEV
jgi:retinaldehyde-binding protein 1